MELKYSPQAKADLIGIRQSVLEKFENEKIANSTINELLKVNRNLAKFPYMGKKVSDATGVFTEYRFFFCKKNYIFYRIEKENILIVRILNEKQDYMHTLFGTSEDEE